MANYWLIYYQVYGYMSVKNVVVKDERPVDYSKKK